MFLSFIIPTLELPLYPGETVVYEIPVFTPPAEPKSDIPAYLDDSAMPVMEPQLEKYAIDTEQTTTYEEATSSTIDWAWVLERAIWAIYFIIVALNLARFAWRIYIIYKLRRHSQLTIYELYTLAVNEQVREPFSFWRTIYMNRSMLSAEEYNQVISHELSHIRHHHTAERLVLEVLRCVAWFNPFVWLAGSALVEVHEWQADSDVLSEGYDVYEYRQLIFRQLFGYTPDLTNGLGSSQTSKKRFLMMTDFKKGKYSFLRLGATLPLVAAMILAFGAVRAEDEIVIKQPAPAVEVTDNATPSIEVVDDLTPAQDSTAPIVCDDENPSTEPALISESDGDEEYNRKFTQATPLITLNHGTYVCAGYGLSHASNPAERNALRKSLEATILKVVSDTEIDVTTDDDWDIFKSGRYTYTLTRDTFTLKNKDASYSFKCEFTGPLYKATLKLIFDEQSGYFTNMLFIGPRETKDKEVKLSFTPNGAVYFNGELTTIEELREKHYMNFNAPIVQPNGTLDGNMEDVVKQKQAAVAQKNPYIYLVVGPDAFYINERNDNSTQFSLAEINSVKTRTQVEKFITEKAPSTMQEFKWWNGKKWNHPVSQGIIYIDVMEGATVANVRAARDMAKSVINSLREKESVKQVNVVYGRLNEPDCATLETAIPENIILSPRAEAVMNLSPSTDVIHIVADQTPRFLGKQGKEACEAFTDWLKEQLKNNKEYQNAFKQNPQYIGGIRVIIEKDGSMSVIDKYYSMGFILNSLITQTCATAPKWTPAKHNGKPVRMQLDVVLHNNDNIDIRLEYPFDKKIKTTKSVPRGVVENPKQKVLNDDDRCKIKITKITLTDEQTVVDLHVKYWHNWWITLESNDKLITESKIYPIQDVKGATLDVKYWMPESGEATFQLIFPPIDCKVDKITYGEDWVIEDIDLSKLRPINEQEHAATPPHLADGEYRPIGVIKKPSQDDGKDVVDKARELLPIIKVKGDKIIVEGNHYKDFVEPGKYTYQILDDGRILINGTGVGYNFPYEYATLSTGANLLDLKFTSKIDNTQILGVMYTREDWEN